ncbi:glycerophosphodiester phosphodiesterase family protein [Kribbia dieselivorans]|uniref:glycerophosphodiester phosphodiesterase family protein n=1 Tax=Kribbia dieselivorans TaxID=331526 RepID=UPI000838C0BB|nr:glycerophosphodiester phosphodiesterase family protein [Kribbia dieselivorans]
MAGGTPDSQVTERSRPASALVYGREPGPYAIAHRGGIALGPENTLAAFGRSLALGLRYIETDVKLTADGQLVCFHDDTLDRATDTTGRIGALTLAQLRSVRVAGLEPIPTLQAALDAFPEAMFMIDLKDHAAIAPMARLLQRRDYAERVCVAGAWDGWLEQLASQCPGLQTALGWRRLTTLIAASKLRAIVPSAVATHGRFAHVPISLGQVPIFTGGLVRRAHRLGIRVIVWTVDDPDLMHRLLDAGVDGIITDRPDVLRSVLVARGAWAPMRSTPVGG